MTATTLSMIGFILIAFTAALAIANTAQLIKAKKQGHLQERIAIANTDFYIIPAFTIAALILILNPTFVLNIIN